MVQTIVPLAHALGKMVTAEGIETPEQEARLGMLGCACGQDYLLSRPVEAEALVWNEVPVSLAA